MADEESYTYEGWLKLREEQQAAEKEAEPSAEAEFMRRLFAPAEAEEQSS